MSRSPNKFSVVFALLMVYIFWGGTYLGIKLATKTIPPFLMAGSRFFCAGTLMYIYARMKGAPRPSRQNLTAAFYVAFLLLLLGNGSVTFASRFVASNISAIIVATVPMWLILLNWIFVTKKPPSLGVVLGILIGLIGIGILVFGASTGPSKTIDPLGIALLLFATISWAIGSLYSKFAKLPDNTVLSIAIQMLCAGVQFYTVSILSGEYKSFSFADITASSAWGFCYLVFLGSIVGYSAYIWLMKNVEPAIVSTYAFVNPVVAVFVGWLFLRETLSESALTGSAIIVVAVVIITLSQAREKKKQHRNQNGFS